jgi:hypothetical protein
MTLRRLLKIEVPVHLRSSDAMAPVQHKQSRGKSCSGLVGPKLLENGDLKVGKSRQTVLGTANAQASD